MHWNYKAKQTSFYGMFISTIMMICQMQICNLVICSSIILFKMFTSCEQNITLKRVLNQSHVENTIQQPAKKLNCIRKLHNFTTAQSLYFIVGNTWTNTFWMGIISLILSSIVKKIISVTETHISGLQNCNISVTKKMTPLIGKQFDCSNSILCTQTNHEVPSFVGPLKSTRSSMVPLWT